MEFKNATDGIAHSSDLALEEKIINMQIKEEKFETLPSEEDSKVVSSEDILKDELIAAIIDDHEFIRNNVSKPAILTLTKEFVAVVIMRTAYSRVQMRVQYPTNYPLEIPIIEISSPTLPLPLLRNKEKECAELAKSRIGYAQIHVIYEHIETFIHTNMFIPCWKEMKQVYSVCDGKGKLGADEKTGILQLRLKEGEYRQAINIKVPPSYPEVQICIYLQFSLYHHICL
jgi:hypothetical protein